MRDFVVFFTMLFCSSSFAGDGIGMITPHVYPVALPAQKKEIKRYFGLCDESLGSKCENMKAVLSLADYDEHNGHPDSAMAIYQGVCIQNDKRGCREWKRLLDSSRKRAIATESLSDPIPLYKLLATFPQKDDSKKSLESLNIMLANVTEDQKPLIKELLLAITKWEAAKDSKSPLFTAYASVLEKATAFYLIDPEHWGEILHSMIIVADWMKAEKSTEEKPVREKTNSHARMLANTFPKDPRGYGILGDILKRNGGNKVEAITAYKKCLGLNPYMDKCVTGYNALIQVKQ